MQNHPLTFRFGGQRLNPEDDMVSFLNRQPLATLAALPKSPLGIPLALNIRFHGKASNDARFFSLLLITSLTHPKKKGKIL